MHPKKMLPQMPSLKNKQLLFLLVSVLAFSFFSLSAYAETPVTGAAGASSPSTPASSEAATAAAEDANTNITLDFKEADINTVLRVMSLKSKTNIVAGPEVQGTITIRLEDVPWEKALQVVLRTYGYVFERDGNIIRVTTRENLAAEPLLTQTYILNYTKASEVMAAVQDILTERGRIKTAERTNTLIVTDIPTNLYNISEVLKKLDKPTPEAFIDSKIVNTTLGQTENLGIEWKTGGTSNNLGTLTGSARPSVFPFFYNRNGKENINQALQGFLPRLNAASITANTAQPTTFPSSIEAVEGDSFTYGTMSFSGFSAVLQMLKSRANTKIVSNPRIVVLNNQAAEIHVGDNIPLPTFDTNSTTGRLVVSGFNYDKLKTGVTLNVVPHINSNEEILVDLQPSVNSRGDTLSFNTDLSAPIINETTAKTQVLISSGQTIAIGGLLTDNVQSAEAKVPYFSDLPLVGKLFRSKRQTAGSGNQKVETLFFVTVTIVDSEGQPAGEKVQSKRDGKKDPKRAKYVANNQAPVPATASISSTAGSKVESTQQSVASPEMPKASASPVSSASPATASVPEQTQKAA